jgi:hypothetical protein
VIAGPEHRVTYFSLQRPDRFFYLGLGEFFHCQEHVETLLIRAIEACEGADPI